MKRAGERLIQLFQRYKALLLIILAGIILLLWNTPAPYESSAETEYPAFSVENMEKRLEEAISAIDGAGMVKVILTLHSDMELDLQSDSTTREEREYENNKEKSLQSEKQDKTVITSSGTPYITKRYYPQYLGALVVCEGGGNPSVKLAVIEAISSLTGLGSDKITVAKMKE